MKHFIIFVFAFLLFSCNGDKKVENEQIKKFETSLGKTETKQLNDIINDFDSFLDKKYKNKNSESRLTQYLEEIAQWNNPEIWKIDDEKLKKYQTSNLFAKYDSIYPDSVWIEDDMINLKFRELEAVQSIIPINNTNMDSLVNELKQEPRLNQISPSKFLLALESIAQKDSQLVNYLDSKEIAGNITLYLLANGLLHNHKNNSDYFTKRIFVMEMND